MKQYLDKDQTAKLIELGFPRPQHAIPIRGGYEGIPELRYAVFHEPRYCIGELIEFLPKRVGDAQIDFFAGVGKWFVRYEDRYEAPPITVKQWQSRELIDSLFDACVTLKEEGVI